MSDDDSASVESAAAAVVTFNNKTLARLFLEHFDHPDTRISAAALEASAEYLRIFTREAVWRTDKALKDAQADARAHSSAALAASNGARRRVMEAQDLAKVAGTLVLDF